MRTKSEFLAVLVFGAIPLARPPRAGTLYTDGPINGGLGGLGLYGVNQVSDSFTLSGFNSLFDKGLLVFGVPYQER